MMRAPAGSPKGALVVAPGRLHARRWARFARASTPWLLVFPLAFPVASAHAAPEVVYVAVGGIADSPGSPREEDPAQVAHLISDRSGGVKLVDLTTPGGSARVVRESQLMRAVTAKPKLVTVALGPWDACGPTTLSSFARDLEIIADLLQRTGATVIISTIAQADGLCSGPGCGMQERVDSFNFTILRVARRHHLLIADVRRRNVLGERSWLAAVTKAMGPLADGSQPPHAPGHAPETADHPGASRGPPPVRDSM